MNTEKALRVGTLLQVLKKDDQELPRYIVNFKHEGRYVVGLGQDLAPTDVEVGMRVACQRPDEIGSTIKIELPLPPQIDHEVSMMTVEQKPNVNYQDLGGLKE